MGGRGKLSTAVDRHEYRVKARRALALNTAGLSWREVADELGYADKSGAHKAGMRAIREVADDYDRDKVRAEQLARCAEYRRMVLAEIKNGQTPPSRAVQTLLKIDEREGILAGIDVGHDEGSGTYATIDAEVAQLMAEMAGMDEQDAMRRARLILGEQP